MVKKTDFDAEFIEGLTGLKKELQDLIARMPELSNKQKVEQIMQINQQFTDVCEEALKGAPPPLVADTPPPPATH
jgi:hypothetical protein